MWHPLSRIAKERNLDFNLLVQFAKDNHLRFSIIYQDTENPMVCTWYFDDFIAEFKEKAKVF